MGCHRSSFEPLKQIDDEDLRRSYVDQIAVYFNEDAQRLTRRLSTQQSEQDQQPDDQGAVDAIPQLSEAHQHVLAAVLRHPALRAEAFDQLAIEPASFPVAWQGLVSCLQEHAQVSLQELLADGAPLHGLPGTWKRNWSIGRNQHLLISCVFTVFTGSLGRSVRTVC